MQRKNMEELQESKEESNSIEQVALGNSMSLSFVCFGNKLLNEGRGGKAEGGPSY